MRKLWIGTAGVVLMAGLAAVVVEVGSFVVLRRVVSLHTWKTHPGEGMSVYRAPWGKRLWEEQRLALDTSFQPYLQRRSKPFIWVFGGLTVWGFGNPD